VGQSYEVDCIIFATGFETGTSSADRFGYEVTGRNGLRLSDYFADGHRTLHGFYTHHFPNFFELGLSQTGFVANFTYMLDQKARHVARLLAHAYQSGYRQIEASERSQQAWVRTIRETNDPRRTYLTHCTPGYFNGQGDLARGFFDETYGPGEIEFWKMMDAWWKTGTFEGLEFTPDKVR
jgi:cyclohexanone monooxygenase